MVVSWEVTGGVVGGIGGVVGGIGGVVGGYWWCRGRLLVVNAGTLYIYI